MICTPCYRSHSETSTRLPRHRAAVATILFPLLLLSSVLAASGVQQAALASNSIPAIQNALRSGDPNLARALCTKALRQNQQDPRLWALDGLALNSVHDDAAALVAFRTSLKLAPNFPAALEGAAQILYRHGDPAGIPLLRQLLTLAPNDPTTHVMLGSLEAKRGNLEAAQENFARGVSALSQSADGLQQYAICLAQLERFSEAAVIFAQALALKPSDSNFRYNLALAQWRAAENDAALASIEPLLHADPPDPEVLNLAAQIYEAQDKIPEAVASLRAAITQNPTFLDNYLDFAALSYRYRSYEAGIEMLNAALSRVTHQAPLYVARGVLYAQLSRWEEAFSDFERADALDPPRGIGTLATGVAHSQQQDITSAIVSFRSEVKQHPANPLAHYLLAEALSEQGTSDTKQGTKEVILEASAAVRLDDTMLAAYDLLATTYLRQGEVTAAINECRRALALNPKDEQALYYLVLALRKTGDKGEIASLVARLAAAHIAAHDGSGKRRNYKLTIVKPDGT